MADRRACDQCHGTDTQRECERGQCYAEHYQAENDRMQREEAEYWQRRAEEEGHA